MSTTLKLATWNVNSIRKRQEILHDWITEHRPHALCLQETKVIDEDFPLAFLDNLGYEVAIHGQKAYNGVAIASRCGLSKVSFGLPGHANDQARVITATVGGICLLCIYAPNGGGEPPKMQYKMEFFAYLREHLSALRHDHAIVAAGGDYNVAPEDADVYDIDHYGHNQVAVSPPEREAYAKLLEGGFVDVHRHLGGAPHSHTWWDYRHSSFTKNRGLRIDHFLVAGGKCRNLSVDLEPRRLAGPSDHTPVILELEVA